MDNKKVKVVILIELEIERERQGKMSAENIFLDTLEDMRKREIECDYGLQDFEVKYLGERDGA